jgi:hypothetical protein
MDGSADRQMRELEWLHAGNARQTGLHSRCRRCADRRVQITNPDNSA